MWGMMFYDDDCDGGNYGRYREKSDAAERRENQAKSMFRDALRDTDFGTNEVMTIAGLIPPNVHLTSACWTTFSKFVKTYDGCAARRRKATLEEKQAHRETRKGDVYWIDVTISKKAQAALPPSYAQVPPTGKAPSAAGARAAPLGVNGSATGGKKLSGFMKFSKVTSARRSRRRTRASPLGRLARHSERCGVHSPRLRRRSGMPRGHHSWTSLAFYVRNGVIVRPNRAI